jgi:hypothetical protein
VVEDYIQRFQNKFEDEDLNHSRGHDDPVVDFCREAPTLEIAIRRACDGRRRDGKLFQKGSCVRTVSKEQMARDLLKHVLAIKRATDFEQLYEIVRANSPWGIGPMTIYAVTERIGAAMKIKPKHFLYLHAGPASGWKRLTGKQPPHRVPHKDLPPALRMIELYHVENLLCEYREALHPGMMEGR